MPACPNGMMCAQVMPAPQTYGNSCMMKAAWATFAFSGECDAPALPKACTKEYMPVCGMVQVQCVAAPCNPVRTDFGNRCMAESAWAFDITDGTCIMSESTPPMVWWDKDEYGCIPSAGYTWDDSMKSCIRSWEYQDEVDWAYEKKITRYTSLRDFKYGNTLTRQEAAAFITRYLIEGLGRPEALCKVAYKDMDLIDLTLTPSISRACGLGVMNGNNGYFHPRFGLTRGEALAVLIRAIDQKKQDETMTPWYQGYMDRAHTLGLVFANMKGFDEPITRGEFIEWLKTLSTSSSIGQTDENLIGTWKLVSYQEDDMMFAASGQMMTLTEKNYQIRLCNSISATYMVNNGVFTTGPAMSTMMACADNNITQMEGSWNLDGASYVLQSPRGGSALSISLIITMKNGGIFTFTKE